MLVSACSVQIARNAVRSGAVETTRIRMGSSAGVPGRDVCTRKVLDMKKIPLVSWLGVLVGIWGCGPVAHAAVPGNSERPVVVRSVKVRGTVSEKAGQKLLDDSLGKLVLHPLDRTHVENVERDLTGQLRNAGLPVAHVLVTQEDWTHFEQTGELVVTVFEGKVGKVMVKNTSRVADARVERVASEALCPDGVGGNCVLTTARIERAELLLQDLPGVKLEPLSLSPDGVGVGQTAVGVTTAQSVPLVQGYVNLDNYGIPASGEGRLGAGVVTTDLFHAGDVIQMSGLATNGHQFAGSLDGSVPLGYRGLRGQAGYSHSLFSLPAVGASGSADTESLGVSYPLVRGLDRNWTVALDGLNTISRESVDGIAGFAPRHLDSGRLTISGNSGDREILLGGSYWSTSAAWTFGHVAQDLGGAQDISGTLGNYHKLAATGLGKLNLGNSNWYVLGSLRGQLASSNLDASEKLAIGGQSGVRAFRADEGSVDTGVVLSLELRRMFALPDGSRLSVGPLLDYANGWINAHPYPGWQVNEGYANPQLSNHRVLAGYGLGLDWVSPRGYVVSVTWMNRLPGSADSANYPGSARNRFFASLGTKF